MVEFKVKLLVPQLPNFIRVKDSSQAIPISALTDDQIYELGNEWTQAILEKARKARKIESLDIRE